MKHVSGWTKVFIGACWLSACSSGSTQSVVADQASDINDGSIATLTQTGMPQSAPEPSDAQTGVFINGRELNPDQVAALTATYGYSPPAGRFWYDSLSGAWGALGREPAGFILPGHDFGPLPADASGGTTGVFINGRQLNMVEAIAIQSAFGAVYPGRWWLDGRTGYFGLEGNPMPLGNLIAMIQAQNNPAGAGGGGDNFWSSRTAVGNSSGGCTYVNVGGTTASSGCD
jgi:hypothetical protein